MRSESERASLTESTRRGKGQGLWRGACLLALLLVGCAQILGLEDGKAHGSCTTDAECAPGHSCLKAECRSGCSSDADCGVASRCLRAIGSSACIPKDESCGDGCPEGTRCWGSADGDATAVCRTECVTAEDCAGGQECRSRVCTGTDEELEPGGEGGASGAGGGDGPNGECLNGGWDHDSNPTTPCQPWSKCPPGQFVSEAGTATTDRACGACSATTFTAAQNAESCAPWRDCEPGEYVDASGTTSNDRSCAACPAGTQSTSKNAASCNACASGSFSEANATSCTDWTDCLSGTHVTTQGNATRNRECTTCPPGTQSTQPNQSECLEPGACPAGTEQTAPATETAPAACAACAAGTFCAGGTSAKTACPTGTWDHDGSSATDCVPWSDCVAGTRMLSEGGPTANRACAACAAGTFSNGTNASSCTPCANGTYNPSTSSASCAKCTGCAAGTYASTVCTATTNRTCTACPSESYSTTANAGSCTTCATCSAGSYSATACSASTNRACSLCPAGTYSSATNSSSCTTCPIGRVSLSSGATSDSSCLPSQISANEQHTCVVLTNGNLRCWGSGFDGQLGYGNTNNIGDNEPPSSVGNVSLGGAATQVAAGDVHTCALLSSGNVKCWGSGHMGYGNTTYLTSPGANVNVGGTVNEIGAGYSHTCARIGTSVRCWGQGFYGQLGRASTNAIGDNETVASAGDVFVGGNVAQITVGNFATCALLHDGKVRCWGSGFNGHLGYGNTNDVGDDELPAFAGDVDVGGTVTQIATGGEHTCALLTGGSVRCWGSGGQGRLGYGNTNNIGDNEAPASAGDVNVGGTVAQIAVGGAHTCALLTNGKVRCWGSGVRGRLGYGNANSIGDNETPASAGDVDVGGTVTQLAAGSEHTCALLVNGNVRCWGTAGQGRLGYSNGNDIGDTETPASVGDVPYL